jgi:peptidoglycan/LPS O-acetylase OafA/YrhL
MKKSYLIFIVAALVLITSGLWISHSDFSGQFTDNIHYLIILLLVGFGVYVGIRRLKSEKRGQPAEDELSKKIMQKASSLSYFISIYLWLGIMYFSDKVTIPMHELFGLGIIGMAIIFAICWGVYSIIGIKNE